MFLSFKLGGKGGKAMEVSTFISLMTPSFFVKLLLINRLFKVGFFFDLRLLQVQKLIWKKVY